MTKHIRYIITGLGHLIPALLIAGLISAVALGILSLLLGGHWIPMVVIGLIAIAWLIGWESETNNK